MQRKKRFRQCRIIFSTTFALFTEALSRWLHRWQGHHNVSGWNRWRVTVWSHQGNTNLLIHSHCRKTTPQGSWGRHTQYLNTYNEVEYSEVLFESMANEQHPAADEVPQLEICRLESSEVFGWQRHIEVTGLDARELGQVVHHLRQTHTMTYTQLRGHLTDRPSRGRENSTYRRVNHQILKNT